MAIDNVEKRRSVAGIVTPNASQDAEWRVESAGLYSGIAISALAALPANRYAKFIYGDGTVYGSVTQTTLLLIIEVDWDGDGVFDGQNEAAYTTELHIRRGRRDYIRYSQSGSVEGFEYPRIGTCVLRLQNKDKRYDPYNTSSPLYPNIRPGRYIRIRVKDTDGTIYPVFYGKIKEIKPLSGSDEMVKIEAEDGLRFLKAQDVNIGIQTSITIADAIGLILDDADWPTIWGRNISSASDELPYWWADGRALTEINDLADADLGTFFVAADGTATYYGRAYTTSASLNLTSEHFLRAISVPQPWEVIRTVVMIVAHPRVQQSTGVLWTLQDKPLVGAGDTLTLWAQYTYDNESAPAVNVITPVENTDYEMNTAEDGSGTDVSANFSLTFTNFGQTAELIFKNNGATAGYITLAQVRGDALSSPDPSVIIKEDTTSQALYGVQQFTLDSKWLQSTGTADDFAAWLISYLPTPQAFIELEVEHRPSTQFGIDLFDVVNVDLDDELGISGDFKVAEIEHTWLAETGQATRTTWSLEPFPDTSGYWRFPATIGVTTVFGL